MPEHESTIDPREPHREEIDAMRGALVLEFGASWCPYCKALAPKLARLLRGHPEIGHLKIEDGPGRPLGRSFGVKLWPNLVFLKGGKIMKQVARPEVEEIEKGLGAITERGP